MGLDAVFISFSLVFCLPFRLRILLAGDDTVIYSSISSKNEGRTSDLEDPMISILSSG